MTDTPKPMTRKEYLKRLKLETREITMGEIANIRQMLRDPSSNSSDLYRWQYVANLLGTVEALMAECRRLREPK